VPGSIRITLNAANPAAQARALVRDLHRRVGAARELIDDAVLITSELVTNALGHGSPPFDLVAMVDPDWMRVEVHDRSDTLPRPREAQQDDEHGWGLGIVAALAARWGSTPTDAGKLVWAEVGGDARPGRGEPVNHPKSL
jgi:anti-sigma regulatory factor (Ser/Thr protein kinase)